MLKIKKIGILFIGGLLVFGLNFTCLGLYNGKGIITTTEKADPSIASKTIKDGVSIEEGSNQFSQKAKGILYLPQPDKYTTSLGYVIALIQIAINWILGILAFIALVYLLYCGFLVFSSGADDKNASTGKKGISTAAIALSGIGLSWLIISAMIRFIKLITEKGIS